MSSAAGANGQRVSMFAQLSPTAATTLAGGAAGAICATACSPLDVTKTRMQAQGGLDVEAARVAKAAGKPIPQFKYQGGVFSACRTIVREEGLRGWFRGYSTAIVIVPIFWSCYFPIYTELKGVYARKLSGSGGGGGGGGGGEGGEGGGAATEGPLVHALAAATAGAFVDVVTNPLWVIRTRLQTQWLYRPGAGAGATALAPSAAAAPAAAASAAPAAAAAAAAAAPAAAAPRPQRAMYSGMLDAATQMLRNEGPGAFFKGLSASLLGCSHVAVQFPVYEELRARLRARRLLATSAAAAAAGERQLALAAARQSEGARSGGEVVVEVEEEEEEELSTVEILIASTASKLVASTATYPHEVVRTRLQDQQTTIGGRQQYTGLVDCVRSIVRDEGVRGLYRGLSVNIVRAAPACAITFVSFEHVKSWLFAQRTKAGLVAYQ